MATAATRLAQQGQRGTLIAVDYLGRDTLQAYGPVDIPGLHWTVVAKIDTSEAFAPVAAFTRKLVLSTVLIIFFVCLAAMLLARLFVRPIRRLEAGAQRISAGNYDVNLPVLSRDEFGELTTTFNDMSRNLAVKDELLSEQRRENDRLLRSLMPEPVVARYREGEQIIAQDHQNVTVIFADIVGFDELSAGLDSEHMLEIVNGLVRQFDAAAENLGVEQVRTLHNGYLASCGLSVPRLDNVRRTVDFAIEMQRILERFNTETGNDLSLRAGIDTGAVSSGLVGRTSLAYDMWGQAVSLAYQVQSGVATTGYLRHIAGVRGDAGHPDVRVGRADHGRRRLSSQSGACRSTSHDERARHVVVLWAAGVAVGLPVVLVLLTELHHTLARRGSYLARPIHLLRNYIVPLGALLILLVKGTQVSAGATPVRIIATVFGFVVLVLLLSGLNATLFQGAPEGSWRKRVPSIFLDVARFALIAIGVGVMFSFIWGADVGRTVHRSRDHVDRPRPGPAELRRADHFRPVRLVRAAVSARRLGRYAVRAWPCG